jgi:ribosomal protein S18 acetylase RimI-like enzyme
MKDKNLDNQIIIKKTDLFDVSKVLTAYNESSDELKKKMMGAAPLTRKLGKIYLYLSTTRFYYFLPVQIDSFVALLNDHVVGFAYLLRQDFKNHSKNDKILGIFVSDQYQNRGIGKLLLDRILEGEYNIVLDVLMDNENAIRLYQQYGFATIETVHHMKLMKK